MSDSNIPDIEQLERETHQTARQDRRRFWMIVVSILVMPVLAILWLYYVDSRRLWLIELEKLESKGIPHDAASMATFYDSRTEPNEEMRVFLDGSSQSIGAIANKYNSLPYINYDVPWLDASSMDQAKAEQFLREFEPLFDRLMSFDLGEKPIRLKGDSEARYRFCDSRIINLIAFKHAFAVFQGDLKMCIRCEAAMDRLIFLSNQHFFGGITFNFKYHFIQRRLEAGMGITEELIDKRGSSTIWRDLTSQAKEALTPEIFFFLRACDQNVYGSSTHEKLYFPASRDIDRRIVTEILQKRIGELELVEWDDSEILASKWMTDWQQLTSSSNFLSQYTTPWIKKNFRDVSLFLHATNFKMEWIQLQNAAVGVRLYYDRYHRWPESLNNLTEIGIQPDWIKQVGRKPFGYRIEDDKAILWGFNPEPSSEIVETPENPEPQRDDSLTQFVYRLRPR